MSLEWPGFEWSMGRFEYFVPREHMLIAIDSSPATMVATIVRPRDRLALEETSEVGMPEGPPDSGWTVISYEQADRVVEAGKRLFAEYRTAVPGVGGWTLDWKGPCPRTLEHDPTLDREDGTRRWFCKCGAEGRLARG